MTYKLLAVDLDGTLLRRDGVVHEVDRIAIGRLQAAGVPVTIATGRLYSGTRGTARVAGVVGPVACVDGSHIVDARDDRGLYSRALAGGHAASVREVIGRSGVATFLFAQDSIVHDPIGAPFVGYVSSWSPNMTAVERVAAHPFWEHDDGIHAVVSVGSAEQIAAAVEALEAELAGVAAVLSFAVSRLSGMSAMVVRASGSTKGTAIEWLAAHHGCSPLDVVVVGDWLNDVPMFKVSGRSFAMAQAPKAVKDAATDHLDAHTSQGGGIAEAIAKIWGAV